MPEGTARPAHPLGVLPGFLLRMAPAMRSIAGPAGAPLGLRLCFFLFSFALYVRRPRRAVPACCRANSSFRVPSGTPAPGFRDAGNNKGYGTLYSVGSNGYGWTSTIVSTSAHFLNFSNIWLRPEDHGNRAYGLPLRCLQE